MKNPCKECCMKKEKSIAVGCLGDCEDGCEFWRGVYCERKIGDPIPKKKKNDFLEI